MCVKSACSFEFNCLFFKLKPQVRQMEMVHGPE